MTASAVLFCWQLHGWERVWRECLALFMPVVKMIVELCISWMQDAVYDLPGCEETTPRPLQIR